MNNTSYSTQTGVYFKKIARISIREKAWVFLVFAVIIAGVVAIVTGDTMFKNLDQTKYGFFTLASACIWIGIFNSIQSICKEHDIIRSEYRQGTKLSAYVSAHILWQAVLCLAQSAIIFTICLAFGLFSGTESYALFGAYPEYFITIFLLTFGASVMGLMVSSFSGTPTTAMKIMPFVLIVQLILCGVLFPIEGGVAAITLSKWGMSAFGATSGLNNMESATNQNIVPLLQKEMPSVPDNYIDTKYDFGDEMFIQSEGTILLAWELCLLITFVCAVISVISLKLKNRGS